MKQLTLRPPTEAEIEYAEQAHKTHERNALLTSYAFTVLQTLLTRDVLRTLTSSQASNPMERTVAQAFDIAEAFMRERVKRMHELPEKPQP